MGLFLRQDLQLGTTLDSIVGFVDNTGPAATMESAAAHVADDLNNMRSILSLLKISDQSGNWYDDLVAPTALEAGVKRGIDENNDALHLVEKKRVLTCVWGLKTIAIASAGDTFDILGSGEIPSQTQARVGITTGLGTVVSDESGGFGAASLSEVAGITAISPKNLVQIVDAASRDPLLDAGDKIYGLLQGETGTDFTIGISTPNRVQISFVKINGTGDDLIAITSGAMDGESYDYCYVERVRFEDLNEGNFLGGANIDVPAGSTVTRQAAYDNQGATVVDLTTNATLDLAAGLAWAIRDVGNNNMVVITEGDGGSTGVFLIGPGADTFDIDAAVNDFNAGVTVRSGGTRPITLGINDGVIETTAGDMELRAFAELLLDDGNRSGSSFSVALLLTATTQEWTDLDTQFGEVSLANMLIQAKRNRNRTKTQAIMTATVAANNDVNGPGTAHNNTDVDFGAHDSTPTDFATDVEVFVNGELIVSANAVGGTETVYPGGTPAEGDLRFGFTLKGVGVVDSITQLVHGQA